MKQFFLILLILMGTTLAAYAETGIPAQPADYATAQGNGQAPAQVQSPEHSGNQDSTLDMTKKKKKKKMKTWQYIAGGALIVLIVVIWVLTGGQGYNSRQ